MCNNKSTKNTVTYCLFVAQNTFSLNVITVFYMYLMASVLLFITFRLFDSHLIELLLKHIIYQIMC